MLYAITIFISVLGFPGPVVFTVDEFNDSKLRFKTEEKCRDHIEENIMLLQAWSTSLFPPRTPIVSGAFDCTEIEESTPGLSVSSDTLSKKI
jgi:hypothetical protein